MSPMAECVRRVGMLSKSELRSEARRLSGLVQENVARLVAHLAEIGRRGLPLEWGYAGLFEYCQKSLGMSEAEAGLRMQVARVVRWCPALLDALAEGRMTLTVAGRFAPHLTEENAGTVIADCSGMTRNQVLEYVVQFRPKPVVSSGISKAPGGEGASLWGDGGGGAADRSGAGCPGAHGGVEDRSGGGAPGAGSSSSGESGSSTAAATGGLGASGQGRGADGSFSDSVSGSGPGSRAGCGSSLGANAGGASSRGCAGTRVGRGSIEAAEPGKFNVRFPAKRGLKEKIDRLAEVLGFDHAGRNLEAIFEQAVEIALEKKDPRRKAERRAARRVAEGEKGASKGPARPAEEPASATSVLPAETRDPKDGDFAEAPCLAKTHESKVGPQADSLRPAKMRDDSVSSRPAERSLPDRNVRPRPAKASAPEHVDSPRLAKTEPTSRYVPESLRAFVLQRANYQCEYVGSEGRRCEKVTRLEVDHVIPYAKGGLTEAGNLRCLCRSHNLWAAEQEFGEEFVRNRIAKARGGDGFIAEAPAPAYRALRSSRRRIARRAQDVAKDWLLEYGPLRWVDPMGASR